MSLLKTIVQQLPYAHPFLFVDELTHVDEQGCEGFYTFKKDEYFYQGHFENHPVTPGVILTECMAQIGLVCLGVFLIGQNVSQSGPASSRTVLKAENEGQTAFVFSESKVLFEKAVYPGEKVKVISTKKYWRLGKLKCRVEMYNEAGERVCSGELSGIITKS
ncbi:3-hydroxymyristoyl/3-hydroxydecanoyl-(acyl carrier protein) dehydratase [Owenweeksia hongkongensis DSM 17368]|uniref:3-hydroxymyristoyl/3-hydroxydecanoyl-(Acyl carrier protein) dehydratase n=1 Tax=Owenweeksia hongkongensis (strain DSM 17368 / CIP 108786 / JCM 12287 / NRRL B-23963 / UST20020801) TaxID=926562 RepID=G8R113_OWEHD|nr:hydroxymyristoyl-ACP dehydratase [Owenweeksia hongkongensis]AEV31684.1 3-hydroxymyristoyl/3-hydroxydecanoyl-(acyl carrier protein) dehydratase [Owenweeksia hongkongensis DSM 17368]